MASFVLTPCKVRADHLVPIKIREPVRMDWQQLRAEVAPGGLLEARKLQAVSPGAYIGLIERARHPSAGPATWVLKNQDRSGSIGWLLARDPSFETRMKTAYRVDEAKWDGAVEELGIRTK